MLLSGTIGASNQIVSTVNTSDKNKVSSTNNNISFLGVAREVAENLSGMIVVAGGANIKSPGFSKEKFEYNDEMPEKIETVYDFLAEIEKVVREAKKR